MDNTTERGIEMPTTTPTIFSTQLQKLRKERGTTQEQLANHLGVSPQAVSKWENGSYPDGDLLPKIADYFEVTIDYLYGRAERDVPVVQQIINELQSIPISEDNRHEEYFEKALEFIWAMQIAGWRDSKWYYPRHRPDKSESRTASCITDKMGFTHLRMNTDLEYYFLAKTPPEGFAGRLGNAEVFARLFKFLGDIINLKVTLYMLSLDNSEVVKASTVAKRLNIPTDKAETALNFLVNLGGHNSTAFNVRSIIVDGDRTEPVFGVAVHQNSLLIMLLAAAATIIYQPENYNVMIGNSDTGWLNRENLKFCNQGGSHEKEK